MNRFFEDDKPLNIYAPDYAASTSWRTPFSFREYNTDGPSTSPFSAKRGRASLQRSSTITSNNYNTESSLASLRSGILESPRKATSRGRGRSGGTGANSIPVAPRRRLSPEKFNNETTNPMPLASTFNFHFSNFFTYLQLLDLKKT